MSVIRPDLAKVPEVAHGSVSAAELASYGLTPGQAIDFSVNTNPLGPAPSVLAALTGADWTRYPGDDEPALRAAIAHHLGVSADYVVLGNGSVELIWLVALVSVRTGDRVAIGHSTFGEYARAVRVAGGQVVDLDQSAEARLTFVCNPNNPDGSYLGADEMARLVDATPGLVAIDEAYAPFVDERWESLPLLAQGNVVVLRSMTKDHALPGVRLGYALARPDLARAIASIRPPWSANAGALRAGLAALEPPAQAHVAQARAVVAESRRLLDEGFARLGYAVRPSAANFVLVEVGDGAAFRRALLPHGIVVRDCASFGLPAHVRVACRRPTEVERLLRAVAEVGVGAR